MDAIQILRESLDKNRLRENVDLSEYTTMKTKSLSQYFYIARCEEDLFTSRKVARELHIPYFLLGGGSNVVGTKRMVKGLIVLNQFIEKRFVKDEKEARLIEVSSGYPLSKLIAETILEGFGGLEYLLGIPGTVGGAIFMNSKWTHPYDCIGDHITHAYLIGRNNSLKKVQQEYFEFKYGYSILQDTQEILTRVVFRLKKSDPRVLKQKSLKALAYRKRTQPQGVLSSGCFFKNIPSDEVLKKNLPTASAGYLIEKSGLKGFAVGDFRISEKHANFIIHTGRGTGEDLKNLIKIIKEKVKTTFGILLKEEVIII